MILKQLVAWNKSSWQLQSSSKSSKY